jgi:hypothetical protein
MPIYFMEIMENQKYSFNGLNKKLETAYEI